MFGYPVEELIGQSFRLLYSSESDFERVRDMGLRQLKLGQSFSDERLMQRKDGTPFWCRVRATTCNPEEPLSAAILSFAELEHSKLGVSLSERERQVIVGLSGGKTSKEIALVLGISHRTVEDVRARLLKKFAVKNTIELLSVVVGL